MDYYGELVEAADIDWLDNLTYRPKVNMSDSLTSLKKQAKAFVDGIVADVAAIEGMDNAAEIMVEYRSNLVCPTHPRLWVTAQGAGGTASAGRRAPRPAGRTGSRRRKSPHRCCGGFGG